MGGEELWLGVSGRSRTEPFDDADQTLLEALAAVGSIALAKTNLLDEWQQQKDKLSVITSSLGEGVCAITEAGEITFLNPAGASMLGWYTIGAGGSASEDNAPILPANETPRFLLDPAMRAIALRRNVTSYDTRFDRPDGSHFPVTMTASPVVGDSSPSGAVIVFRDTSERKAFEEQLARHAFQDALTGLANRRLLLDHLDHALLQADRTGSQVAVLFCDIDRFKVVNDNLGHQVGDELLRVIGDRLRRAVRPGDTLSRFGGDEFVILLEGVISPDDAIEVVNSVLDALHDPVVLSAGHEVVATMSIGVALSEYGKSRDDLLHDADVAMYRAKDRGRGGQFALFDVDRMGGRSVGRLDLDTALHHVVERGEVEIHYQPLVSLADRQHHRRRGVGALEPPGPRPAAAEPVHPAGRGQRHHPRDRPLGPRAGLPAGQGLAGEVRRSRSRSASTCRPVSSSRSAWPTTSPASCAPPASTPPSCPSRSPRAWPWTTST